MKFVNSQLVILAILTAGASANSQQTGVASLPASPPPTGLQAPLPPPLRPLQEPLHPLISSPTLQELMGRVPDRPITINEAVAIGLANSRALGLAAESLQAAEGAHSQSRTAFNPTLAGAFTYTRLGTGQSVRIGGQSINIVNANQPILEALATMPIDISGMLKTAKDQSQFQEVIARIGVNQAQNDEVLAVKKAFYNVLKNQALVVVARKTLQDNLDRLSDAQKKLNAGTAAPFDALRAQTDVANSQQQLIAARSNGYLAIAQLNNAMGISIDTPLKISEEGAVQNPPGILSANEPAAIPAPNASSSSAPASQADRNTLNPGPGYESLVQEALANRPEALAAHAGVAAAKKGMLLAERSVLPTAAISAQMNYSPNAAGFSPQTTTESCVLSITIPIFDGGLFHARLQQAHSGAAQAVTLLRQANDLITLDVRTAYLTLIQARDQVDVDNQALVEAKESYRLALVRYNSGVSAMLEVSDAQTALTQAEENQVNALYTYNSSRSALDHALGRYSYSAHSPGYASRPGNQTLGIQNIKRKAR